MTPRTTALAVLALACALLTGCTTTAPGKSTPTMTSTYPTPDQTRTRTLEIFTATRTLIGGTNWEIDGQWYGNCPLPDGTEGAEYIRQESGDINLDSATMAKRIAALWETQGYPEVEVKRLPSGNGWDVTYGMDSDRVLLSVSITDHSATIHMSGGCIPGDSGDLDNALVE